MNYGSDCGCPAPAPKLVKTIGVQPLAPTEEIVCPDSRCMPHLLNSLAVTDDAVPNYVGVYKGKSYIAPIRAAVDSVLKDSLNGFVKSGAIPVITNARDLEALPVIQKGNCDKVAMTALPVVAEAMMASLPAAPVGYEPNKVMTTDKEGDVYLATPAQVVSPALIPAAIENCEKSKFANVPVLTQILGFGAGCKEFGMSSIKQLQEALAKALDLAPTKTLPDTLRGFKNGVEYKYPVTLNAVQSVTGKGTVGGTFTTSPNTKYVFGKATGPTLPPGFWIVSISYNGAVGSSSTVITQLNYGIDSSAGYQAPVFTALPGNVNGLAAQIHSVFATKTLALTEPLTLTAEVFALSGSNSTIVSMNGDVLFTAQQVSATNLVVNGVS